jgi:hypothetical protein
MLFWPFYFLLAAGQHFAAVWDSAQRSLEVSSKSDALDSIQLQHATTTSCKGEGCPVHQAGSEDRAVF